MHVPSAALAAVASLLFAPSVLGQTFTKCSPLQQTCPADPALGRTVKVDFSSQSSEFTGGSGITYGSDGAALTISKQGDSPTLVSNWYIMFGRVDVSIKAAPGQGIVSSFVMQSDDLDEIDLEWLGTQPDTVASNYFGKGITGSYDRGANHPDAGSQTEFTTYTVIWTSESIAWQINGQTVRVLQASAAGNQFPQTPMQIKIGSWAGGDPSNAPGVISWAGGQTNYAAGPYTMYVQSVSVQDYSTGTEYSYGDNSGSWQSIKAAGGSVSGGASNAVNSADAPSVSSTSGQPIPFGGTHAQASSTFVTPSVYPWVGESSTATAPEASCYTGKPDGWTCTANGKVVPPSAASSSLPASTSAASPASSSASASSGREAGAVPIITSIGPYGGGPGPAIINATSSTTAPSSTLTKLPSSSVSGPAAAPPAFTGAASSTSVERVAALLGCAVGAFALFL